MIGGCGERTNVTDEPDAWGVLVLRVTPAEHTCDEVWAAYGPSPYGSEPTVVAAMPVHIWVTVFTGGPPDRSFTAVSPS